jgi:BlaI family penicillinase repressor
MAIKIGSVQLRIMRVLWDRGESTAREINESLSLEAPSTHSTVQTLLRQLEAKGAVGHRKKERTFFYRALVAEEEVSGSAAQDLLARLFRGSLSGLVAHLLEHEQVSPEEMKRLKEIVNQKGETS